MTKLSLSYLRRLIAESGGGGGVWGSITGTLSSQTDLQSALNAKEASISAGTTSQYWRGDKSWQTLNKSAVGLGNVDNTADVNKSVASAAILTTARKINGVSFNGSADIITDIQSQFYTEFGSTICGVHFAGIWPGTGTVNMADQIVYFVAAKILKDVTIDGAYYRLATNGNYTANNNNRIGLYTQSAGTLTLQASCANNGNLWKPGSAGFKSTAFTSGYSATAGETVWFGFLYCRSAQTTAPALSISAGLGTDFDKLDFTNSVRMFCYKTGQTDLPASIAFSTMSAGGGNIFWMVPYT